MVETLLSKAYDCVKSKQNLVPYKIHVLDKSKKEAKTYYINCLLLQRCNKNHELQAICFSIYKKTC
ncbi:MAG: hypothetical protein CM15mV25_0560 [uncultured marine virus]|nr:MAG: hypothetical protein CM15mV25_0560 [uncultured marine virus]